MDGMPINHIVSIDHGSYVWFVTMKIIHVPFVNIQKTMENYHFLIGKSTMNNIHPLGLKKLPIFPCKMTINWG
jgi:hypothetical protein